MLTPVVENDITGGRAFRAAMSCAAAAGVAAQLSALEVADGDGDIGAEEDGALQRYGGGEVNGDNLLRT